MVYARKQGIYKLIIEQLLVKKSRFWTFSGKKGFSKEEKPKK
jgi:hypothetical protein